VLYNLKHYYDVIPIVGIEIEFYLSEDVATQLSAQTQINIKQEKGVLQYEIDFAPTSQILDLIDNFNQTKALLALGAEKLNSIINFAAKPYKEDYGSSVHIHINLINKAGCNLFDNADYMHFVASILCKRMNDCFLAFAPTHECYSRFDYQFMAPTKICWGNNNRSVAIRVPASGARRLEHRVSSSMVDLHLALYYILRSIDLDLQLAGSIILAPKIYGNAFDAQYNLENFPACQEEASSLFKWQL